LYVSLRAAWLSPTLLADVSRPAALALFGFTAAVIAIPIVLALRPHRERAYARGLVYFAIVWPLVAVAPLVGANQQRHLYFSSVGIAVALGLAGARLLASPPRIRPVAAAALGTLLVIHALLLTSGVAAFAENGRLSQQLRDQLAAAAERSAPDTGATIVVLPEVPNSSRHLWEYALPLVAEPMFLGGAQPARVVGSFTSCHCQPQEWLSEDGPVLQSLVAGTATAVYVIEWDPARAGFSTRLLDGAQFRVAYLDPGGALLRPRRPDLPTPVLAAASAPGQMSVATTQT
jgi:hypothetical protein